jgi:hypothetical protein
MRPAAARTTKQRFLVLLKVAVSVVLLYLILMMETSFGGRR